MAIPALFSNIGGAIGNLGTSGVLSKIGGLMSTSGDYLSDIGESQAQAKAYANYMDFLSQNANVLTNALQQRGDEYENRLINHGNTLESKMLAQPQQYEQKLERMLYDAEPQYMKEANTQLAELNQLNQDIANQSAEAQRQNRRQVQAELAQQGIRGGQAGILANRATGELNRNLQRDINQNIYNEAANRQNSRLSYLSQKALYPYKAMTDAYGTNLATANNNISGAYANAYTNAMNTLGGAYGSVMTNALNNLSNAQGNSLQNAYTSMYNNFLGSQNPKNGAGIAGGILKLGGGLLGTK